MNAMNTTPFSLRIFVADGDPDGLRIVDKSNWIGKALVFPRALLPQVKARPELAQTGVYLLLGPRPDGEGDMLYVGEGDPIRPRLESHYAQKDFWTRAIGFTTATMRLNRRPRPQLPRQLHCSPAAHLQGQGRAGHRLRGQPGLCGALRLASHCHHGAQHGAARARHV